MGITSQDPTRVFTDIYGHTSISKVDYILTNADLTDCNVKIFEPYISDHRAILLEFNAELDAKAQSKLKVVRALNEQNLNNFIFHIKNCDFHDVYENDDADSCFKALISTIQHIFEFCCPLRKLTNNGNNQTKYWLTPEIVLAKKQLMNLYWLQSNLKTSDTINLYKKAKSTYTSMLRESKRKFYNELIISSDNKSRTVWSMVNTLTGRSGRGQSVELDVDGVIFDNSDELVNIFAEYFSTITQSSLDHYYQNTLSTSCTTSCSLDTTFFFHPVLDCEIADTVKSLRKNKSSGADSISAKVLKLISTEISRHIAHCINLSISSGVFPSVLKRAIVIPIPKNNDIHVISNYRPISLLSTFAKVFERIVLNRMMKYLDKFNILASAQHGFRSGRSTQTAAICLVDYVYKSLDDGFHVAGLFFDLSRAFDSLSFQFILDKCYNLGFRGVFLDWLRSYLEGRSMCVKLENSLSADHSVNLGVPQGSVLGPLLFLIFINDLPGNLRMMFVDSLAPQNALMVRKYLLTLFADDVSVVITAPSFEELQRLCGVLVSCFADWCHRNNLMINIRKTECIYFTLCQSDQQLIIHYLNDDVLSKESAKFLGIHLDSGLRWFTHVDSLCNKLNSSYFAISRVKDFLPPESLRNIYYCLVYSHLSYNILLWGNSSDVGRAFILQKRILRMMYNIPPRQSCRALFVENCILTLSSIFILKCLLHVKENEADMIKLSSFHNYKTRSEGLLHIPKHRTAKFEMSPTYQSIKLYNHLPFSIRHLNYNEFKKNVKSLLLEKCYYTVNEYLYDCIRT